VKILLDYDPATGSVIDPSTGGSLFNWSGLEHCEHVAAKTGTPTTTQQLIDLKAAGYSVGDISDLKKQGIL
jgi:hypothetical protein